MIKMPMSDKVVDKTVTLDEALAAEQGDWGFWQCPGCDELLKSALPAVHLPKLPGKCQFASTGASDCADSPYAKCIRTALNAGFSLVSLDC